MLTIHPRRRPAATAPGQVRAPGRAAPPARPRTPRQAPAAAAAARVVGAAEALDRPSGELLREPGALVPDVELDEPGTLLRGQLDGPGSVDERVVDEVPERLLEAAAVGREDEPVCPDDADRP